MYNCVEGNAWKSTLRVSLIASILVGCCGNLGKTLGTLAFLPVCGSVESGNSVSLIPTFHRLLLLFRCNMAIKAKQWSGGEMQHKIERKQSQGKIKSVCSQPLRLVRILLYGKESYQWYQLLWDGQYIGTCHCLKDNIPRSWWPMEYLEENINSSFKLSGNTDTPILLRPLPLVLFNPGNSRSKAIERATSEGSRLFFQLVTYALKDCSFWGPETLLLESTNGSRNTSELCKRQRFVLGYNSAM